MGRWGSNVLNFSVNTHSVICTANIQKCPETNNTLLFFTLWSPKRARWVGEVHYLGQSPNNKKTVIFLTPSRSNSIVANIPYLFSNHPQDKVTLAQVKILF